jgi:hypothetical protein
MTAYLTLDPPEPIPDEPNGGGGIGGEPEEPPYGMTDALSAYVEYQLTALERAMQRIDLYPALTPDGLEYDGRIDGEHVGFYASYHVGEIALMHQILRPQIDAIVDAPLDYADLADLTHRCSEHPSECLDEIGGFCSLCVEA